jgi:hypothetical protein
MIVTDFVLEPDDAEFKKHLGKQADRVLKSQRNKDIYEMAKQELVTLAEPKAAWQSFPIQGFVHDKILLENGVSIGGGPVVQVICGATELAVGVCTIGPGMEKKVKEYIMGGESFHALVLDLMASWAAGAVRDLLVMKLQLDHYHPMGFHTSLRLGPGESDWSTKGQQDIFDLLGDEPAEIGMHLEPSMLMIPIKSTSFIMGAGPNDIGRETGSSCEFCQAKDTCEHRT